MREAAFWRWVGTRPVHKNPRGRFIQRAKVTLREGGDPGKRIRVAKAVLREYEKLKEEYEADRKSGR